MPNWTKNIVVIAGAPAELERFRKECTSLTENRLTRSGVTEPAVEYIDFEKIVPYPAGYDPHLTSPAPLEVRATYEFADGRAPECLEYDWIPEEVKKSPDPRSLIAFLHLRRWPLDYDEIAEAVAGTEKLAEKYSHNEKLAPGCPTWYEFNHEHWGTKWNACSPQPPVIGRGYLKYVFDTAWDAPRKIYQLLYKKYRNLKFTIVVQHEDEQEIERLIDDVENAYVDISMDVEVDASDA